jgi:glycosyltransferase involved in cell wall biosynthesis
MKQPLVTIAMPVRNCEKTIAASVRSVLNQTFHDWEMLLIDDASTDKTMVEVRRFKDARLKVRQDGRHKGLPARLNEAIQEASGMFLARMDGDDVCYPIRLESQLQYLNLHPEVDLVGGGVLIFGADGQALGKRIPPEYHNAICRRTSVGIPIAHPTFLGLTQWFRHHRYSEAVLLSQDQDLLLRAYETSCYANIPNILLGYREELKLVKLLRTRRFYARMLLAEHLRKGRPIAGGWSVLVQYVKGAVDIMALLTGLQYRILRHRAMPVTGEEVAEWQQVWLRSNRVMS